MLKLLKSLSRQSARPNRSVETFFWTEARIGVARAEDQVVSSKDMPQSHAVGKAAENRPGLACSWESVYQMLSLDDMTCMRRRETAVQRAGALEDFETPT